MSATHRTVLVAGAGYAGVMAANRLRSSLTPDEAGSVRIVVINASGDFIERIRLHQVAGGSISSAAMPLRDVLHKDVEVVVGNVVEINAHRKQVYLHTAAGPRVGRFDTLIYAVGSGAASGAPGVEEFAYMVGNSSGARQAQRAMSDRGPGMRVVVVGGGATGVETAAEIAEQQPEAQVSLLCGGELMGSLPRNARTRIARRLRRLGVSVREEAYVSRVRRESVELADGTLVPSDVTVWAAAFTVPQLARTSGFSVDEIGRLLVDETLRSVDHPDIIGAGDAVRPPPTVGAHLRMGCAIALPLGGHAANTALAQLRGAEPQPLSAGFVMQCLSLGRSDGYIQFLHADGTSRRLHASGWCGARIKEFVSRLVLNALKKESKEPGSYWSPAGPRPRGDERAGIQAMAEVT